MTPFYNAEVCKELFPFVKSYVPKDWAWWWVAIEEPRNVFTYWLSFKANDIYWLIGQRWHTSNIPEPVPALTPEILGEVIANLANNRCVHTPFCLYTGTESENRLAAVRWLIKEGYLK